MDEPPLPGNHQLLAACRGDAADEHPLLCSARELTELHERRLGASSAVAAEIDFLRAPLIRDIDRWVHGHVPRSFGAARFHTETVGAVIDRLAQYTADAYAALADQSDSALGDAWERLAELAIGYQDLIDEVSAGHRRLPGGQ